jgi:hypothetical protein
MLNKQFRRWTDDTSATQTNQLFICSHVTRHNVTVPKSSSYLQAVTTVHFFISYSATLNSTVSPTYSVRPVYKQLHCIQNFLLIWKEDAWTQTIFIEFCTFFYIPYT